MEPPPISHPPPGVSARCDQPPIQLAIHRRLTLLASIVTLAMIAPTTALIGLPVAVPLVARPPLILIALSAVADQHLGVVVGGLAIGIAAFVGVARFAKPSGVTGRSLRWLGRADAMVLALLAVFLIADGVLGV